MIVPIVLNRNDVPVELEDVIIPGDQLLINPKRRKDNSIWESECIRRLALSDNYVDLNESDLNVGHTNDANFIDEVVSCSDSGN